MNAYIITGRFPLSGIGILYTLKGDMGKLKMGSHLFDDTQNEFVIKAVEMINYRNPEKYFRTDVMSFLLDSEHKKSVHGKFLFGSPASQKDIKMKEAERTNSMKIPENAVILADEPLPDMSIEDMKMMISRIDSTQELVDVYAAVSNKAFYIVDDVYDYEEGSDEYKKACQRVDAWFDLMEQLEDKVMKQAESENLLEPKKTNSGTLKQIEKFMHKYGYKDGCGWWVELDENA